VKKLSDLGERKAIDIITEILSKGDIAVGPGDDCAAVEIGDNYLLVTTDMISQKTHIPKEMAPSQIGWFIVAINLSDIAAKGGVPIGLVLSFGMKKDTSEEFLKEVTKGANLCATKNNTFIVGGDMKETNDLFLSGTAVGLVKKDKFMPRKGAKPRDIVAVTGTLGRAGAGYFALENKISDQKIIKGLLEPHPRLVEGRTLSKEKIVSSCMDISDGLSSSLYQLQDLNHVGFEIYKDKLPIASELKKLNKNFEIDVYKYALHFGGDYELLVTLPPDNFKKAGKSLEIIGKKITVIGRISEKENIMIFSENDKNLLENKGYEHFKLRPF